MNKLLTILEAYRNGERDLPGYAELMEIGKGSSDPDDSDWIKWEGGECPVPVNTRVDVKMRHGGIYPDAVANTWIWFHVFGNEDIISYRPAKDAP